MRTQKRTSTTVMLAAAMLATATLAACDAIPDSGSVRPGLENLDQVERGVQFNPPGPQPGASEEEIVRGFMRAASSSTGDYETARQYLAPNYANTWDPSLGVIVDEGTQSFQLTHDTVAVVTLHAIAHVDASGAMTSALPGGNTELPYELTKVGDEWRISSAPAGIVLDKNTFSTAWTPRALYYVSGDNRLVADWHWFLNRRPTLATQVVRELLNGPSTSMAGALRTSVPQGTTLVGESVPIVDKIAVIDLSQELFEADESMMQLFSQQLAASLQAVDVEGYRITVNGTLIDSGAVAGSDETPSSEHQYVAVMKDGEFGAISSGTIKPIKGISEVVAELDPIAVTMAADRSAAAVLYEEGVAWVGDNRSVPVLPGRKLLTPSLDILGNVWIYNQDARGEVTVSRPGSVPVRLAAPWLEPYQPVALRVSTGGNRIAALVKSDGGSMVLVAGIVRDADGTPTGFTREATVQLWSQGTPIDLDWIGDTRFAALTSAGLLGSSSQITIDVTGQFPVDSGSVAGGTAISGGSRSTLRVLDDQHKLFWSQGTSVGWQLNQSDVQLLAKVG